MEKIELVLELECSKEQMIGIALFMCNTFNAQLHRMKIDGQIKIKPGSE